MKTKVLLITLVLLSSITFAQRKVADKFFKNFAYVKATELYKEAIKKGDDSEHVLTRLGDCYYFNSKSESAAEWYGKAVEKYPKIDPEYIYKYILTLRSIGDYDKANLWIKKFEVIQSENKDASSFVLVDADVYEELASTEGTYIETINLSINSEQSEFGGFEHNGKFYFSSARNTLGNSLSKVYAWNEEPFLNIYESDVTTENGKKVFSEPKSISSSINTRFHEASIAISNDGNTLYYTRDNITKKNRLKPDRQGTTHLNIFKATLVDGSWENSEEELPFNGKLFSTGHPALSPDNKTLFFVSDKEGGYGLTDIYKVTINDDGTYGEPENLGPKVNTAGKEMFPYVDSENTLYFSSEGFTNLGLLDIFKSNILNDPDAEPKNLGAPFNSGGDDFSYFKSKTEDDTGYFASNSREDGQGSDDIYIFFKCQQIIKGIARNSITLEPLQSVKVELIDKIGKIIKEVETNVKGEYSLEVECNEKYTVRGSKPDYKDDLKEINTSVVDKFENITDLTMVPLIIDDKIVINPIFFDFDKWEIRDDAKYELESIVDVMREHPSMVIKIESHTDSRGTDKYNMKLSDRRAKSTADYLLSRGIDPSRIESAIGYGESQLINDCGRNCTEAQHQENRRSYFYILKN